MNSSNLNFYDYFFEDFLIFEIFKTNFYFSKFKSFLRIHTGLKNDENLVEIHNNSKKISYQCKNNENTDIEIEIVEIINEIKECIIVEEKNISSIEHNILIKNPEIINELEKNYLIEIIIEKNKMFKYNLFQRESDNFEFNHKFHFKEKNAEIFICEKIPENFEIDSILINLDLFGNFLDNFGKKIGEITKTFFIVNKKINQLNDNVKNRKKNKHLTGIECFLTVTKGFNIKRLYYSYIKTPEWPNSYKNQCQKFFYNFTYQNNLRDFFECNKDSKNFVLVNCEDISECQNTICELKCFLENKLNNNINDKIAKIFIISNNKSQTDFLDELMKKCLFLEKEENSIENKQQLNLTNEIVPLNEEFKTEDNKINIKKNIPYENPKIITEIGKWFIFNENDNNFIEIEKYENETIEKAFNEKKDKVIISRGYLKSKNKLEVIYTHKNNVIHFEDGSKYKLHLKESLPEVINAIEKENINEINFFICEKIWKEKKKIEFLSSFFEIDFGKNIEINVETLQKRKIKRVAKNIERILDNYEIHKDFNGEWQFFDNNEYCCFPVKINKLIEKCFSLKIGNKKKGKKLIIFSKAGKNAKKIMKLIPEDFFKFDINFIEEIYEFCKAYKIENFKFYFNSKGEDCTEYFSINLNDLIVENLQEKTTKKIRRINLNKNFETNKEIKEKKNLINESKETEEIVKEEENSIEKIIFLRGMIKNIEECFQNMMKEFEYKRKSKESIKLPNLENSQFRKEFEDYLKKLMNGEKDLKITLDKNNICLEGFNDLIHNAKNKLFKFFSQNYKNLYVDFPKEFLENNDFALLKLNEIDNDYKKIGNLFNKTMKEKFKVIKIEKILNKKLYKLYSINEKILEEKVKGNLNKMMLFHGTSKVNPKNIYEGTDESFDMRLSNNGMWGKGIYFAEKAIYSHNYAYNNNNKYQVIVAEVILGESTEVASDQNIKRPPIKNKKTYEKYDSIKGFTNDSFVYIVYENNRAYPYYLITYDYRNLDNILLL